MVRIIGIKRVNVWFFFFFIFLTGGCGFYTPTSIKNSFSFCYDGRYTGIDTLMRIDGFYYIKTEKNSNLIIDESNVGYFYPDFMFYKNGFVHDNAYIVLDVKRSKYALWLDNFSGAGFGRYILCDDTIKLQFVDPPGGMAQSIGEVWFKIVDNNNLRLIFWGDPDLASNAEMEKYLQNGHYRNAVFTFHPMARNIDPTKTWIYHKRWFRCKDFK